VVTVEVEQQQGIVVRRERLVGLAEPLAAAEGGDNGNEDVSSHGGLPWWIVVDPFDLRGIVMQPFFRVGIAVAVIVADLQSASRQITTW
jgi:hypothetical protein